jgi:hypothetical protein
MSGRHSQGRLQLLHAGHSMPSPARELLGIWTLRKWPWQGTYGTRVLQVHAFLVSLQRRERWPVCNEYILSPRLMHHCYVVLLCEDYTHTGVDTPGSTPRGTQISIKVRSKTEEKERGSGREREREMFQSMGNPYSVHLRVLSLICRDLQACSHLCAHLGTLSLFVSPDKGH